MPRILPVNPANATGDLASHLDTARKMFGGTPNVITTTAQSPSAVAAMLGLFATTAKLSLGAKIGEQIAIAVAQSNGCEYCLSAHTAIGKMLGVDAAELAAAQHAESSDARIKAILTLAAEINRDRGHISDAALATARLAGVTDAEVMEIVAHVAINVFTNYVNNVAKTDIDFPIVKLLAAA